MNETMKSNIKEIMWDRLSELIAKDFVTDSAIEDLLQLCCIPFQVNDTPVNQTELLELANNIIQSYRNELDKASRLLNEKLTSSSLNWTLHKPVKMVCPICKEQSLLMVKDNISYIYTGIVISDIDFFGYDFIVKDKKMDEYYNLFWSERKFSCGTCGANVPSKDIS